MRFHLKRSLQVTTLCACFLYCLHLFLTSTPSTNSAELTLQNVHGLPREGLLHNNRTNKTHSVEISPSISEAPVQVRQTVQHSVYPNDEFYSDDRILSQLSFVPESVKRGLKTGQIQKKKILVYSGLSGWGVKPGEQTFQDQKCAVPYCELADSRDDISTADVVLFQGTSIEYEKKLPHQKWLLFMLESPYNTQQFFNGNDVVNWTATYRHDSTIVAPYEKFRPYNASVLTKPQNRSYAEGKTKQVAWFVSNCLSSNKRREYADELAKYIQVDIYGSCGKLTCSRSDAKKCFEMLNTDYKFYLSFENSNCRDYITEKFFVNGLKHNVIPIVMGAAPEDYERAAPPHSYIHVDEFESPKALAEYLLKLDKNDSLYNEYFQWKGTGDLMNTFFWCRVCALAHDEDRGQSWYPNIHAWWNGEDICIGAKTWRDIKRNRKLIADLPVVLPPNQ